MEELQIWQNQHFERNSKLWTFHLLQWTRTECTYFRVFNNFVALYSKHYDSIDLNLNWENLTVLDTKGSKLSNLHRQNVMATVIWKKQTLSKIHPNSGYSCRSLSSAVSNTTEKTDCRCRYIIKFAKMEFSCLYQSLPFSSCNLLSPLSKSTEE